MQTLNVSMPAVSRPRLRLDLGLRQLLPEWRALVSRQYLREDLVAGLTVAASAIPLSLAIALASGVAPEVGLVSAAVAGLVCALFGGTPLAVSGPAAALSVLVVGTVQEHGLGGLLVVGLVVGVLQILTGVLGLGRLIRYVPVPVVAGFISGLGAIVLIGQLPRAFGLPPPDQNHVVDVITHLGELWHLAQPQAVGLAALALGLTLALLRLAPRVPACFVGVLVPTVLALALGLPVATLGELSGSLPRPHFPSLPEGELLPLLGTALMVYALASLQTLLYGGTVDRLTRSQRPDLDQDLIGQGLGNLAVSLFGGMPITAVIIRSVLNVKVGARTRRSGLVHALVLLASLLLLAPVLRHIPLAALAGVLLSIALRLVHPRTLVSLWRTSRTEALVYLITFATVVAVDLAAGVQAGILVALAIAAVRLGTAQAALPAQESVGPYRFILSGPITFLSSNRMERLRAEAGTLEARRGVVLDMSAVTSVDASGAEMFIGLVENLQDVGAKVALKGLRPELQELLLRQPHGDKLKPLFALTETDVASLLQGPHVSWRERLVHGVERFRQERLTHYRPLFDRLAHGQQPHTLFITCADSRINPNLLTSTQPGELFLVRNVGNLVPRHGTPLSATVGSAIEYAVAVLGVTEVIVCGHSSCGAMKALLSGGKLPEDMPSVARWLEEGRDTVAQLPPGSTPEQAAQLHARLQVRNALSYPVLRERVQAGKVRLHVWYYDVGTAELLEWSEQSGQYAPVGSKAPVEQEEALAPLPAVAVPVAG